MATAMKDSGIAWVNDIPLKWDVMANKYIMTKIKHVNPFYQGEDILSLTMNGVIIRDLDAGGKMPSSFDGYQTLYPGNLLMCLFDYDVTPRCIGLIKNHGVTSPAYSQFVLHKGYCAEYYTYYYLMVDHTKAILHLAKNLRHSFTEEQLGAIPVPFPPLVEQRRIALFLDMKCAEIDALMADVQAQIETLEQYKRSVITEAVTGSVLTPIQKVKTGDSYWPELPSNWALRDNKYIFEILKRIAGREGYNVLSITHKGIKIKDIESNEGQIAANYSGYQFVYPGDFAMNGLDLNAGWCDISELFGVTSPDYRVFHLRDITQYNANFYRYVIQLCYMNKTFYALTQGVTESYRRLSTDTFNNFRVPVPPYEEQMTIAQFLDTKCAEIDAIIDGKRQQLAVLEEYKKSVIFEYVTGKKEVPISCPQSVMKQ